MNIIKQIIENFGYVTEDMLPVLAKDFPKCSVVIKWDRHPRSSHYAFDATNVIMDAARKKIHAREVFISAANLDKLKEVLMP